MIERTRIRELIKVFYQKPFKIFYVNSTDGETFTAPTGLFISLGLTTNIKVIEGLRNMIANTYPESNPKIVELSSRCVCGGDQYLNTITNNLNPEPYVIDEFPADSLDRESAEEELKNLREKIIETKDTNLISSAQNLQELIDKLSQGDGWESRRIVRVDTEEVPYYKIFHRITNYKKEGEIEYRVGIYVE